MNPPQLTFLVDHRIRVAVQLEERGDGANPLPDVAASLNNLGLLLKISGELAAARPLYERSLAIQKAVLGPDHPDVATGMTNLADLYILETKVTDEGVKQLQTALPNCDIFH